MNSAVNQTRAGADGQSKPIAFTARASRETNPAPEPHLVVQLVIDTGSGNLFPVSDDHYVDPGMMWSCTVWFLDLCLLNNMPASEAIPHLRRTLSNGNGYDAPKTKAFLNALLDDCSDSPRAVVSVIEFPTQKQEANRS